MSPSSIWSLYFLGQRCLDEAELTDSGRLKGVRMSPELTDAVRLVSQSAPRIFLFLSPGLTGTYTMLVFGSEKQAPY